VVRFPRQVKITNDIKQNVSHQRRKTNEQVMQPRVKKKIIQTRLKDCHLMAKRKKNK